MAINAPIKSQQQLQISSEEDIYLEMGLAWQYVKAFVHASSVTKVIKIASSPLIPCSVADSAAIFPSNYAGGSVRAQLKSPFGKQENRFISI